jgi:hypothetical protein
MLVLLIFYFIFQQVYFLLFIKPIACGSVEFAYSCGHMWFYFRLQEYLTIDYLHASICE